MQLLILSPKSLKHYLVFYFKLFFFTHRISLKDTLSVFLKLLLQTLTDTLPAWQGKNMFIKLSTFSEVCKILLSHFSSGS